MIDVLTKAGIALCLSLVGHNPTYDECSKAISRTNPPCDFFFQCPAIIVSNADEKEIKEQFPGGECVRFSSFKRYDGTTGYETYCNRPASIYFIPGTPLWRWEFDKDKK